MRNIDYNYGDLLIKEYEKESEKHGKIMSKEADIKAMCDSLLMENTVESISRLMLLAFEHTDGSYIMDNTDWGKTIKFALNILKEEKDKESSLVFKTKNLAQLLYVFDFIRRINYRANLVGDYSAKEELELVYKQFNVSEVAKEKFFEAIKLK